MLTLAGSGDGLKFPLVRGRWARAHQQRSLVERRGQAAELEEGDIAPGRMAAGELGEQDGLQRPVHDQARVTLDVPRVPPVEVDAVRVIGQRRETEEQGRRDVDRELPRPRPGVCLARAVAVDGPGVRGRGVGRPSSRCAAAGTSSAASVGPITSSASAASSGHGAAVTR
jgi:hypothetical protein